MAFQSVPGVAEVDILFTCNSQPLQNTFYFQRSNYTQADLQDLADAIDGGVGATFLPIMPNSAAYIITEVRGLQFENDLVAVSAASAGIGGQATEEMPLNVTLAIKRISGLTGRSARGRIFWSVIPISGMQLDRNYVTQAWRDDAVAACNGLSVLGIGAGWLPVIVSRFSGGAKRPTGVTFPLTAYTTTDLRVDSQRNRLPG